MLKHKKFLSLLLLLPVFSVFSCAKATETYQVIKHGADGNLLTYDIPEGWTKPIEAPFELKFDGLTVKFADNQLDAQPVKTIEEAKSPTAYFICTSDSLPSKTIITNYSVNWTNAQVNTQLNFYIAHLDNETTIHLSDKITINVINNGAIAGPWVIPVISIGVAVIVLLMIFFTRKYKAKKEGKI